MLARIKLMWWWYVTIQQHPSHPNIERRNSTMLEKKSRRIIASLLADGYPFDFFVYEDLHRAGFTNDIYI